MRRAHVGRVAAVLVLAAATAILTAPASAAPPTAYVRVNQIGYPTTTAKRAFLMASGAETGATFAVKNGAGTTVFTGSVGASAGNWSSAYPNVYALDFG